MNARALAVLFLVLSLALTPVLLATPARAQAQYAERLDVYTAGQNSYWLMTFSKLNSSVPALSSAESGTSGITGYTLTALSTQDEVSDYQIFGTSGYNVLALPFYAGQGLYLTINESSASSSASSLISYFDSRFGTSFSQVSSSSGTAVYFAPANFDSAVSSVLFKLVPTAEGGFASFVNESSFLGQAMPAIELSGTYNGSAFSNTLRMGAATAALLGSGNAIDLSEMIGSSNATLSASSKSTSSEVVLHDLDGLVVSTDAKATISNNATSLTGSYSLAVPAGDKVRVNASLQSAPDTALAYRILDQGALSYNSTLGVTIVVTNTAKVGTLDNVTINDNWWQSYPNVFQLTKGNSSFTIGTIPAGKNVNASYVLRVVANSSEQVVIPSTPVSYSYDLSSSTFNGSVGLGEDVVQVNQVGPAIMAEAQSTVQSGTPVGTAADYNVTVTNDGNSPAFNLQLGTLTLSSLSQGSTHTFSVPISASDLKRTNYSSTFTLQYSNKAGQSETVTTNAVKLVLSHTSMYIPFVSATSTENITATNLKSGAMNATYIFTNTGKAVSSGVSATETFPSGVQCKVVAGNGNCSGGTLTVGIPTLNSTAETTTVTLTFGKNDYSIPPVQVTSAYEGLSLSTYGAAYAIPAGISVTKNFNPTFGFPGTKATVTVDVDNVGSTPVYNVTADSLIDPFDTSPTGTTQQTYATLSPGQSESFNYTVTLVSSSLGNVTSAPVSTSFIFAGTSEDLSLGTTTFEVLGPVVASVTSSPSSPEENHDFTLAVLLTNPADVTVTDIVYALTIPSGLSVHSGGTVSGHVVTITVPTLAPDSNTTVDLKVRADTDLTIDTSDSHLTFEYQGSTFSGTLPTLKVVVGVDATTRYILPIGVAVIVALVAVIFLRRRVGSVAAA